MSESFRSYSRINNMAPIYVQIAVENYYQAKESFERLKKADFDQWEVDELHTLEKHITVTIVFSAMALESLLNDYAAWRLGDDEYYDSFDQLKPIDKLNLIVRFIHQQTFDKSQSYYGYIKKLFTRRNELVHNKSEDFFNMFDENHNIKKKYADKMIRVESGKFDRIQIQETLRSGKEALLAIKEVAQMFDQYDDKAFPTVLLLLFHPQIFGKAETKEELIKENVYRDLGIEIQYFKGKEE